MTKRVFKNIDVLKALHHCCNGKEQKAFLKRARPELVNALCDCINNVLLGHIPLNKHQHSKLKSKKRVLRELVKRKNKTDRRRKLLVQHGGALLPFLLPAALTALGILKR